EEGVARLNVIALDDTIFDRRRRHPDWPIDQAAAWYQAPVGGLNLNDNCLDVAIDVEDGRIRLDLTPAIPASFIDSRIKIGRHQPRVTRAPDSDIFEIRGSIAHSENLGPIAVGDPTVFFGYALRHELEVNGIECGPQIVRRTMTVEHLRSARLLAIHKTALRDVLWRANTYSQNLFAECLLKSLAAYEPDGSRSGRSGGWESGHEVLRETLAALGVDLNGAVLRDGSGLSHDNRVTARQVVALLKAMQHHRYSDVFLGSLARAGRSGSMRRRYADPQLVGRLIGKTGTIAGVRTLAGLLTRDDGGTLLFALLIEGNVPASLPVDICKALGGY
ncbi:MAG: D-alanyl-D-alanine carboxypeptidase/D-alanyl-D-alanine-endopeptidase, partial [Planctomycetota bacterium]